MKYTTSIWIPSHNDYVSVPAFTTDVQIALSKAIANDPLRSYRDLSINLLSYLRPYCQTDALTVIDKFAITAQWATNDVCGVVCPASFTCSCETKFKNRINLQDMWTKCESAFGSAIRQRIVFDERLSVVVSPLTIADEINLIPQYIASGEAARNHTIHSIRIDDNEQSTFENQVYGMLPHKMLADITKAIDLNVLIVSNECPKCAKIHDVTLSYSTINAMAAWMLQLDTSSVLSEVLALNARNVSDVATLTPMDRAQYVEALTKNDKVDKQSSDSN